MSAASSCTYRFISSSLADLPDRREYDVIIRQQPERAKMSVPNERDRRPIDPPPILQMQWLNCSEDDIKKSLQSPFYYLVANIVRDDDPSQLLLPSQEYLSGSTVSSLYRLRDIDNSDGGFFVFGDLAVKKEGRYRLHFSLFEITEGTVQNRKTLLSDAFTVYLPKRFPGPHEATFLSRTFCDQGVKMRIRKEHRLTSGGRKRKLDHTTSPSSDDGATSRRPSPSLQSSRQPSPQQQQHGIHMGRWYASTPATTAAPSLTKEMMHAREPVFVQHHHHHHQHSSMPSPPPCTPSMAPQRHTPLPTPASSHFEHPVSTPPPGLADYHYTQQHPPQQHSMFAYHHNSNNSDAPPLTPPSTLGDISPRHSISTSNDRLPSLSAIIADSLPNTSRHLPAPIPSAPAFGTGRVPIQHLLQSHPF
ncbi:developmental regulator [Lichtheimia corymbifera JMRC:FSU:9682]|uniref:Developmental regulator n=1 Tax=Lichtheimia corymbifera JMRC:FSU:9682 TaxID=1263082 RepID=A0A068RJZ7_9FUNG|nr:developmental regulator [Lichtheimia corymbifera JMRC:FSU:9682]